MNEHKAAKKTVPQWVMVLAITLPVLLFAAVISWRSDDRPAERVDEEVERATDQLVEGPAADQQGEFAVQQSSMGDFDSGRQVPSHSARADFWYQARTGADRYFSPREDAVIAVLGRRELPALKEVKRVLDEQSVEELDVNDMSPGEWVAVRTSEGNFAAFTIKSHAGISPGTLRLEYVLWEGRDAVSESNP